MPLVFEGISMEAIEILNKMALCQKTTEVTHLDKESLFTSHAEQMLDTLKYQRHNLHLAHFIKDRERQNARDKKELDKFKEELKCMKEDMNKLPSAEANRKEILVFKGKVANYENFIEDAKKKEDKLAIKPEIRPESLKELIEMMEKLQHQRDQLKTRSDNITIARSSKKDLIRLKTATKDM